MRHRNFLEEFHEPCTRNMTLMGSHMYVLLCSSGQEVVQMQLRKSRVCIGFPSICPLHAVHGTLAHPHIGISDADPFEFHSLSHRTAAWCGRGGETNLSLTSVTSASH